MIHYKNVVIDICCKVGAMNIIKRSHIWYVLVINMMLVLPGCNWFSSADNAENKKALHIINVNDKVLYDDAHIKGDSNIPFEEFENLEALTKGWNKASEIVIYCTDYACTASKIIAKEFLKLGFKNAYVYTGGAAEWHKLSKENPAYEMLGSQKQHYLNQLNEKIETSDPEIRVVTAEQLLQMIQKNK